MNPHARLIGFVFAGAAACGAADLVTPQRARIAVHPHAPTRPCAAGLQPLGVSAPRDAKLYVPAGAPEGWPLLVLLHGAGGSPDGIVQRLRSVADAHRVLLLAPASTGDTWDGIRDEPGPDVTIIGRAIDAAYDRCAIGPRLAVGGFSDGASYALTLGIANGDLFTHILAFSPCGLWPGLAPVGRPRVFISHGREDEVLPFARCGEALAKRLQGAGYTLRFEPFIGTHTVPPDIATRAFGWFVEGRGRPEP